MQKPNRRILSILAFAVITIILLVSILLSRHQNKTGAPNLDSGRYYDANSGETVSNPPGKAPDTFGAVSDQPVYLGFGSLLDYGVSDSQLTSLKSAFYTYARANKIKEVSMTAGSAKTEPRNPANNDPFIMDFSVVLIEKQLTRLRWTTPA